MGGTYVVKEEVIGNLSTPLKVVRLLLMVSQVQIFGDDFLTTSKPNQV